MIQRILLPLKDLTGDPWPLHWTRQAFPHVDLCLLHVLVPERRELTPFPMMAYGSALSTTRTAASSVMRAIEVREALRWLGHGEVILADQAAPVIVQYAEAGAFDAIVLGRGPSTRGALERVLGGSVTARVARTAPVPVLLVPEGLPGPPGTVWGHASEWPSPTPCMAPGRGD